MPKSKKEELVTNEVEQSEVKVDPKFRRFYLVRKIDKTGMSGTGYIAEGIQFSDGSCTLRWLTTTTSTGIYHSIVELEYIHGHNKDGGTQVEWVDI